MAAAGGLSGARGILGAGAAGSAAIGAGAAAVAGAYFVHPAVGPALAIAAVVFAVTLSRPEVGLAAWFTMIPLGELGLLGNPHWLLPSVWAALLFALAAFRVSSSAQVTQPPFLVAVLAFAALTVIQGLALTDTTSDALPAIRMVVVGTMVFYAMAVFVRTREQVLWMVTALAVSAAIPGLAAIREYQGGATDYGFITASGKLVARVSAGFAQPNQLGGFLILIIPMVLLGLVVARRGKVLYGLAVILGAAGIYLSFSRGALIGLVAGPIVLLGLRKGMLAAPLGFAAMLSLAPGLLKERFATLTSSGSELATRNNIWNAAEGIWSSNPVVGVGPGGFPAAYATERLPGKDYLPTTLFEPPPHAHNVVLQVLAEQGIVGLMAFMALAGVVVAGLFGVRRAQERWVRWTGRALLGSLAAFMVHNMFDVTLLEGTGEYLFAFLGLAAALVAVARAGPGLSAPGAAGPGPPA